MGRAVTVLGMFCTGHADFPPRPSTSASGDVFDISFLARTNTEIGVSLGEKGN